MITRNLLAIALSLSFPLAAQQAPDLSSKLS
jgi:hypothetical protein